MLEKNTFRHRTGPSVTAAVEFQDRCLKPLRRRTLAPKLAPNGLAPAGIERDGGSIRGPVSPQRASFLGKGWDRPERISKPPRSARPRTIMLLVDKIRRMEPTESTVGRRFRPFGPDSSVSLFTTSPALYAGSFSVASSNRLNEWWGSLA